jgi:HEAT repeat protein
MTDGRMTDNDIASMIADYMEQGFLDNIIDMFKHDSSLYALLDSLIRDERVRVRIGVTALMEELKVKDGENISRALVPLLPLVDHGDPVVRGDAANLIGIIGDREALPFIERLLADEDPNVRLICREAIEEIKQP